MANVRTASTTNHFGHLVDNIYEHVGKEASNVVNSIHLALVDGTPRGTGSGTPVDTGTLKANWHAGIRPNSSFIERQQDVQVPEPIVNTKTYGINHTYYIWNNSPYLNYVNDGIVRGGGSTPNSMINLNFVQKAIAVGLKNASSSKGAAIAGIRSQGFF